MNHEGHEDHEEDVFVFFVATLNFSVAKGRSGRYARFVSGRVWICLPVLFDPDTDPDSLYACLLSSRRPLKKGNRVGAKHRVGRRRPRRAAGYWTKAIIEIEIEKTEPSVPTG